MPTNEAVDAALSVFFRRGTQASYSREDTVRRWENNPSRDRNDRRRSPTRSEHRAHHRGGDAHHDQHRRQPAPRGDNVHGRGGDRVSQDRRGRGEAVGFPYGRNPPRNAGRAAATNAAERGEGNREADTASLAESTLVGDNGGTSEAGSYVRKRPKKSGKQNFATKFFKHVKKHV